MSDAGRHDPAEDPVHEQATTPDSDLEYQRRRQHVRWYGAAVLLVLVIMGVVQLIR